MREDLQIHSFAQCLRTLRASTSRRHFLARLLSLWAAPFPSSSAPWMMFWPGGRHACRLCGERLVYALYLPRAAPASRCWMRRLVICLRAKCSSPLLRDHSGLDASLGRYKSFPHGFVDAALLNWDEDKVLFAVCAGA